MLAFARGFMANPKILLVDEPSLGLAPLFVLKVFETLKEIRKTGIDILLVEQSVMGLEVTDRTYVMDKGRIIADGASEDLKGDPQVLKYYLKGKAK